MHMHSLRHLPVARQMAPQVENRSAQLLSVRMHHAGVCDILDLVREYATEFRSDIVPTVPHPIIPR